MRIALFFFTKEYKEKKNLQKIFFPKYQLVRQAVTCVEASFCSEVQVCSYCGFRGLNGATMRSPSFTKEVEKNL